jgi:hypothetical protein
MIDKNDFDHVTLMNEEEITVTQLPVAIKNKISGWNLSFGAYSKNPTDDVENKLKIKSMEIANEIQDWIDERDRNPEPVKKGSEPVTTPPLTEPVKKDDATITPPPPTEPVTPPTPPPPVSPDDEKEKKILDVLASNRARITISQLTEILGKEPDLPEQRVGRIVLRKVHLERLYYRVK